MANGTTEESQPSPVSGADGASLGSLGMEGNLSAVAAEARAPARALDEACDRCEGLGRRNELLMKQLMKLVKTERHLFKVQNRVDRQLSRLQAINALAVEAPERDDPAQVLARTLDVLAATFSLDAGRAYWREPGGDWTVVAEHGISPSGAPAPERTTWGDGERMLLARAERTRTPLLIGVPEEHRPRSLLDRLDGDGGGQDLFRAARQVSRAHPSRDPPIATLVLPLLVGKNGPKAMIVAGPSDAVNIPFHHDLPHPADEPIVAMLRNTAEGVIKAARHLKHMRKANEELRSAYSRLSMLDELKTNFINMAAHELNTPLTPVRLQLHLLRQSLGTAEPEQQARALEILDRNVKRIEALVRDVLDSARLQSGHLTMEPEEVNMRDTLGKVVESFLPQAEAQGIELGAQMEGCPGAVADPHRIEQVLYNLMSNALKFTPRGGRVDVTLFCRQKTCTVLVKDTGIGIDPERSRGLFKPFSQVHDRIQRPGPGTGLGLYISRGIVEEHGGKIWCRSKGLGHGCTFGFWIPMDQGDACAIPTDGGHEVGSLDGEGIADVTVDISSAIIGANAKE